MKILMNNGGIAATNSYLIADEISKQAVIFDAPNDTTEPLLDEAQRNGWDVVGLWLTHGHFDHVAGHAAVTERFPKAIVLIHPDDEIKLQKPKLPFKLPIPIPFLIPPRSADGHVLEGDELMIGSIPVRAIYTPGHSPGHVAYYLQRENVLVGGDLIIMQAIGRTDFADSSYSDLAQSIRRIMKLPGETKLLPGHGEPSTLEQELQTNPYVQQILDEP
ncbi:MAG: MBL fold metallo-hydrolase [Phycisphaerales bacterium]|jgi:glyoxylase-like metal-dependent hydrolase (beta-lactamase superfamily II)|nr:MBL fold metallo-hydrolase [Phycisphaerales bacterium]